jgi:Leucine Rich Repeat
LSIHLLQGLNYCNLQENPAIPILSRLTLLSLSGNQLNALPDALPADAVHNLRVLDISGNALLSPQPAGGIIPWAAENILAFDSGWSSLQVLGIQSSCPYHEDPGLTATAKVLQRLLQRQADAVEPRRPPPTVVCDMVHDQLLRPARELAAVT